MCGSLVQPAVYPRGNRRFGARVNGLYICWRRLLRSRPVKHLFNMYRRHCLSEEQNARRWFAAVYVHLPTYQPVVSNFPPSRNSRVILQNSEIKTLILTLSHFFLENPSIISHDRSWGPKSPKAWGLRYETPANAPACQLPGYFQLIKHLWASRLLSTYLVLFPSGVTR